MPDLIDQLEALSGLNSGEAPAPEEIRARARRRSARRRVAIGSTLVAVVAVLALAAPWSSNEPTQRLATDRPQPTITSTPVPVVERDGDAEDRAASLFTYSQGGWDDFVVGWESDEQVRDWVTTAVFVRLLDLRADPDGSSWPNTGSIRADFEVLDVVGGQHAPVRSPDLDNPRGITVIIDVQAKDPNAVRAELEANIGSDYLLFLTEATDRSDPETGRSPYYRVWPVPLVTYSLADDGTYQPAVWSYLLFQDAERRGADKTGEIWTPQPLPPLMTAGEGGPIKAITGRSRPEIMSTFAAEVGQPTTPIPDGMHVTEPSPYPVIAEN